jgi:acyl dehydratase
MMATIDTPLETADYGPVTRTTLAVFAGASGDFNPIHLDPSIARDAGHDDVIVHGMLSMAYLSRWVVDSWPEWNVTHLSAKFVAKVPVGATLRVRGTVEHVETQQDGTTMRLAVDVTSADEVAVRGQAHLFLPAEAAGSDQEES